MCLQDPIFRLLEILYVLNTRDIKFRSSKSHSPIHGIRYVKLIKLKRKILEFIMSMKFILRFYHTLRTITRYSIMWIFWNISKKLKAVNIGSCIFQHKWNPNLRSIFDIWCQLLSWLIVQYATLLELYRKIR